MLCVSYWCPELDQCLELFIDHTVSLSTMSNITFLLKCENKIHKHDKIQNQKCKMQNSKNVNVTKYKTNKMQNSKNVNVTKCRYDKMQIKQNANMIKCKKDKMQNSKM